MVLWVKIVMLMAPGIEVAEGAGRRSRSVRFQRVRSRVKVTLLQV
jgi:hypothetical protein